ncbi:OmpH family outer membrane protein [Candidatus Pelagibacter sp.]|uniref:OmpH family outer membrane protein n=1 Tax=Candidatus Pelagibacter sp. TaxID=2024849 RepID=UPI003F863991
MKFVKFFILVFIINIFSSPVVYSKENLAFINLDEIIKKSNYGKTILSEIKLLNDNNNKKLKEMEEELKLDENNLNKRKNLLSKEDFENELDLLKEKIINFREYEIEITKNFEVQKNKNLNIFFSKINPIIQEYMDQQSINILFRQENIFIGKSSADITNIIIDKINTVYN